MKNLLKVILLCALCTLIAGQSVRSRSENRESEGRTLGLLGPLLRLGLSNPLTSLIRPPLASPPIGAASSYRPSSHTQSDPIVGNYGNNYVNNPLNSLLYGYNPSPYNLYASGYNTRYGPYGNYFQNRYLNYYQPNYGYGGYNGVNVNNGYNGGYNGLNGYNAYNGLNALNGLAGLSGLNGLNGLNSLNGFNGYNGQIAASPTLSAATSTTSGLNSASSTAANSAQALQLAGILGQALGTSLRPLLANASG